jgi:hypothetical protein
MYIELGLRPKPFLGACPRHNYVARSKTQYEKFLAMAILL